MDKSNTTIRIRELSETDNAFMAVVSFNSGPEYPITVHDPFTKEQEQELEWYFEEHLRFPFTKKVRASEAAQSITVYGETLFKQVFVSQDNPDIYANYRDVLRNGLQNVRIEIVGEPPFHALHWEALKDPAFKNPLALQATMVRQNLEPLTVQTEVQPSPTINLLIVTARPLGNHDVGYRTISRPLVEMLHHAHLPVQIDILRPGTYKALENHLLETTGKHGKGYYHVIHFDTHGGVVNNKAFLFFESEQDSGHVSVKARELASLLQSHQIPIVILNACQSGKQVGASKSSLGSHLMQVGVQLVLAMGYSVTVSAAELLMQTLYKHLFAEDDLSIAIRDARAKLFNDKSRRAYFNQMIDLEDWLLPVVYQNQPPTLHVRDFTPEESKAYHEREAERERTAPPEPTYGFVGRDLDILQIEKRLLLVRNILLVRGMGGAGKTTLLRHLGAWWRTTGFVNQVFYFGYNDRAWTRQQILVEIAQQLLDPVAYVRDFQPLSLDAQQSMLARKLRAERHLLILDNLESITGTNLAIQHTLDQPEQNALHSFVAALKGGHTLVLLGSRGSEDWLAKGTFDDSIYTLNGLDPEAASTLADLILKKHHATHCRDNEDLRRLLKLLDGFPLALEVVLSNLVHTTPGEILSALQAGDVQLDIVENKQQGKDIFEQKTESILRCIDYSHSNLSPEAQQLLLCLAPFTSVFNTDLLTVYTAQLQQQPVLANLPYHRWSIVLQEVSNWGLLNPDPNIPRFLRLQPTLPYFLRSRLQASEQANLKTAIETAFREHYDNVGDSLYNLLESKEPDERQVGQFVTGLEYENLVTALNLTLAAQLSIENIYFTLSDYLDARQEQQRGLSLGQDVLAQLEKYPEEKLAGKLGVEFTSVIDNIAKRQLLLKQYAEAEKSYKKALSLLLKNKGYTENEIKRFSASIYHELGSVAQKQRQWSQAEQYYQQALQIYIEFNDRNKQSITYHQLGMVAQEQHQMDQAKQYYQHSLQLKIEFNDRYEQGSTYHELGIVAQEQRQWTQAEQYYQQALQIYIEFNAHYEQASTYHQLGIVAQKQRQLVQARDYLLQALEIFVEYKDVYYSGVTLRNIARLWHESGDASIPAMVAERLGMEVSEVEELLREALGEGGEGEKANENEG